MCGGSMYLCMWTSMRMYVWRSKRQREKWKEVTGYNGATTKKRKKEKKENDNEKIKNRSLKMANPREQDERNSISLSQTGTLTDSRFVTFERHSTLFLGRRDSIIAHIFISHIHISTYSHMKSRHKIRLENLPHVHDHDDRVLSKNELDAVRVNCPEANDHGKQWYVPSQGVTHSPLQPAAPPPHTHKFYPQCQLPAIHRLLMSPPTRLTGASLLYACLFLLGRPAFAFFTSIFSHFFMPHETHTRITLYEQTIAYGLKFHYGRTS